MESHLLQMRGLKQNQLYMHCRPHQSHLLQMRGLKLFLYFATKKVLCVASFTDAWIETVCMPCPAMPYSGSHLLQMRGLKLHTPNQNDGC